jgi:hypothetical protein
MTQKKKLQVFVSSTYNDLREERQTAVEAILTAGHIPAGMELFAAGDESQMNVIRRWIDESDVYLLILGGRYGSVEPKTQKSYIHLEYDYAVAQGKPLFAVVIEEQYARERVKTHPLGLAVVEIDNAQKLKEFRAQVLTRMIRFWADPRDIKIAIMETMAEFSRRTDLRGWTPGNEGLNTEAVAMELTRLTKENAALRDHVGRASAAFTTYNGLTFGQMYKILLDDHTGLDKYPKYLPALRKVATVFGDPAPGLIHLFWMLSKLFRERNSYNVWPNDPGLEMWMKLAESGLVERVLPNSSMSPFIHVRLTDSGRHFLLRLKLERKVDQAEEIMRGEAPINH